MNSVNKVINMQPGFYYNLSNNDYHGGPGISKSGLDLIAKSPAHYAAVLQAENDNEPTVAQAFGTAFHTMILEPHIFARDYVGELLPDETTKWMITDRAQLVEIINILNVDRLPKLSASGNKAELINRICDSDNRYTSSDFEKSKIDELKYIIDDLNKSRAGLLPTTGNMAELAAIIRAEGHGVRLWSEHKAEWQAANDNKIVLPADQMAQLESMRDAVMAHPAANALLTGCEGVAECSAYWNDWKTGELCRVRPDFWRNDGIIIDVKTTQDASPEAFAKSLANWRYHVQAPMYSEGIEQAGAQSGIQIAPIKAFAFLAVEKTACVVNGVAKGVAVYVLDAASLALGKCEYRRDLDTYAACKSANEWPGYSPAMQQISLPGWYLKYNEVE